MKLLSSILFVTIAVLKTNHLAAQERTDNVVLRAMQDELKRNMDELRLPDFENPFFMMYGIVDQKNSVVTASLGSLLQSSEAHDRFKSTTRVLVGDYKFNDESLEDNLTSSPSFNDIDIPLDDDYLGIRRSFWSTTDKVYRDAARNFEKNKEALKETGKSLDDVPHRSFAKANAVKVIKPAFDNVFDKAAWETKARKLSNIFTSHSSIWNSSVIINYSEGTRYLVNTEGTMVMVPFHLAVFTSVAINKDADGGQAASGVIHFAATPDKLPDEQQLIAEINGMISQLESQSSIPKLLEDYSGPVLLMGQSVADVFSTALSNGNSVIVANDHIPKLTGYQFDNDLLGADNKIGKVLMSESVSVSAEPTLKTFNGTELLGSFDVDNEGIVPAAQLTVVDKGVLKCLLNNRTLTDAKQTANGFGLGPGVLRVSISEKNSEKSLRKKLIDRAKKQGLEYAIIARSNNSTGVRLLNIYKVSVANGKEELVRGATLGKVDMKALKRIAGATEKYEAYNVGNNNNAPRGGSGLTSFIVPSAVLFDELDINRFHLPSVKETEYVQNPLK